MVEVLEGGANATATVVDETASTAPSSVTRTRSKSGGERALDQELRRQLNEEGREDNLTMRCFAISDYPAVRGLLPHVSRCSMEHPTQRIQQLLDVATYHPLVVEDESGQIIAFAELHRLPHLGRNFDGRLEKVIVREDCRGRKIAQRFCRAIIEMARDTLDCGRIDLTVEKPDARHVYTRLGFTPVDTSTLRLML